MYPDDCAEMTNAEISFCKQGQTPQVFASVNNDLRAYADLSWHPASNRNAEMQNAEMQKCRNAEMQKCRNAEMQQCSNAEMQKCRNAEKQKCRNAEMQKCRNVFLSYRQELIFRNAENEMQKFASRLWLGTNFERKLS